MAQGTLAPGGRVDFWHPLELSLLFWEVDLYLLTQPTLHANPHGTARRPLHPRRAFVALAPLPVSMFSHHVPGCVSLAPCLSVCRELCLGGTRGPGLRGAPLHSSEMGRGREGGREEGKIKAHILVPDVASLTALSSNLIKFPQTARRVS